MCSFNYTVEVEELSFLCCLQTSMHWTHIYTGRLGPRVKLVGSTINCQPVWWHSDPANEMRHNPHVQSYVMATDQVILTSNDCRARLSEHHIADRPSMHLTGMSMLSDSPMI